MLLMLAVKQIKARNQQSLLRQWSWIMDRSRHTNTKKMKGSQVDKFINKRIFKTMNELPEHIYEIEMSKSRIDHKEPIIVGFFILQYARLTTLQLKYNFFSPFCDRNKYELIETDTDCLYMALSEGKIDKIIRPEMRSVWYWMRQSECTDSFAANSSSNFFSREFCQKHAAFDKRTPGLLRKNLDAPEWLLFAPKRTAVTMSKQSQLSYPVKDSTRTTLRSP